VDDIHVHGARAARALAANALRADALAAPSHHSGRAVHCCVRLRCRKPMTRPASCRGLQVKVLPKCKIFSRCVSRTISVHLACRKAIAQNERLTLQAARVWGIFTLACREFLRYERTVARDGPNQFFHTWLCD